MLLSNPGLNKKINDVYEDQTPLYIAASLGKANIVLQLIRAGADPCKGHLESANSPLHIAASRGDIETANALLQSSSVPEAVNQRNKDGKTPLHLAAENGHVDVLRMLIAATRQHIPGRAREIIDAYARDGRSPLLAAARAGHHHVVELLEGAGADLHSSLQGVKGMSGTNAVYMAAQQGHIKVIETLVDILKNRKASGEDIKAFIDVKPEHGFTPLLAAITSKGKDPGIVKLLVKLGADIRHGVRGWSNSIHYAAQLGKSEIIKVLVEAAGNDANFIGGRDVRGKTPLSLAAQNNRIDAVRTLLSLDADGAAALLEAAQNNDVDTIKALFSVIEKDGQDELTAALDERFPGNLPRAALGDPEMAKLFDEVAGKTEKTLHTKLNANDIPLRRPVQITRLLHEMASSSPRVEPGAPLRITETKAIISLPKLISQNGHICKLTALANLDLLYATNRGIPNIPLRKNRSGYYASQINEYHSGDAGTSIREKAKRFGSSQGEILQVDDLKTVAREMGYMAETLTPGDLDQCRAHIVEHLNKGAPLVTFFQVSSGDENARRFWPRSTDMSGSGERFEHAALIVGIDTRLDTVDLAHRGEVFPGIPLTDLHRSMDTLPAIRQPEVYERTNMARSEKERHSYKKYEFVSDPEKGAMQDRHSVEGRRTSITPVKEGFKNCLLLITPDKSHARWADTVAS